MADREVLGEPGVPVDEVSMADLEHAERWHLAAGFRTDPGLVRVRNEDSFAIHLPYVGESSDASPKACSFVSAQCTIVNVAAWLFMNFPIGCSHSAMPLRYSLSVRGNSQEELSKLNAGSASARSGSSVD